MTPLAHATSRAALPPIVTRPRRSAFITALGWFLVVVSGLACLVSAASLLMLLARSPGSQGATLVGGFVVIVLPPMTLIAGLGLLRRWHWAYAYVLVLLSALAIWNVAEIVRGPTPRRTHVSATGVPTTVLATEVNYPAHVFAIVVCLGVVGKALTPAVRREFV